MTNNIRIGVYEGKPIIDKKILLQQLRDLHDKAVEEAVGYGESFITSGNIEEREEEMLLAGKSHGISEMMDIVKKW